MDFEGVEPFGPGAPIGHEPGFQFGQSPGFDAVEPALAVGPHLHDPRLLEDAQVSRDAGLMDARRLDEVAHRAFALTQRRQDAAACRVGDGFEGINMHNHAYSLIRILSQAPIQERTSNLSTVSVPTLSLSMRAVLMRSRPMARAPTAIAPTATTPKAKEPSARAPIAPLPTAPTVLYSNPLYNQYYKQAINSRQDRLFGLTLASAITPDFDFKVTGYYEDKKGYGVSPEAYATSLTNYNAERLIVPGLFAPKGLQYGLSTIDGTRKGVTGSASYRFGIHTVQIGGWYERDFFHRTQQRYNQVGGSPDGAPLLNEPVHLQRNFNSVRDSSQFSIKDTIALLDGRLKVDVGFKALNLPYKISGARNPGDFIANRRPTLTKTWVDNFLPQVGAVFNITPRNQIFASYSESMALPRGADDIFAAASPAAPGPEAERAKNRRDYVLRRMHDLGYIDDRTWHTSTDEPITAFEHAAVVETEASYVAEMVRAELYAKHGEATYTDGFVVTTTIDDKGVQWRKMEASEQPDRLILATDPDREGEAISWHVLEILSKKRGLKDIPVERVVFNAITKSSILEAMAHPRQLDMELVNAYLARRALDYLVGFTLSPVLWRKLPGAKSAGRVQSVALRLICERESEIEVFKSREYWTVDTFFGTAKKQILKARLTHLDGRKLDKFDLNTQERAEQADITTAFVPLKPYREAGRPREDYDRDLIDRMIPFVEGKYHVSKSPMDRAYSGLSGGGMLTNTFMIKHPEVFQYYGMMSAGLPPANATLTEAQVAALKGKAIWIGGGWQDSIHAVGFSPNGTPSHLGPAREVSTFVKAGVPITTTFVNGGHEWSVWRVLLKDFLTRTAFLPVPYASWQ